MSPNNLIFIVVLLYNKWPSEALTVNCTKKCDCDMYKNLRRANCDYGKMLTLIDNVPKKADILEFSFNYVSVLENNIFLDNDLTTLKLLNLSHNHIQDIQVYAFYKMDNLKTIDLSNNYLQFLLAEWFWSLPVIEEFYINNNNLGGLQDEPKIESNTLKVLNLAYCKISHLQSDVFSGVPNLQHLNLIGNLFATIKSQIIQPLTSLQTINLKENTLNCDVGAIEFDEYCQEKQIELDYEICQKKIENSDIVIAVPKERNIKKQNAWIIPDLDNQEVSKEEIKCPILNQTEDKQLLLKVIELSPIFTLLLTLIVGFGIGLVVGCTVEITRNSGKARNKKRLRTNAGFDYIEQSFLIEHMQDELESTPMPTRKTNP